MDCEGFLGPSTPGQCSFNPYDCSAEGCDFGRECTSPAIDVACCHLYPDCWLKGRPLDDKLEFCKAWIQSHIELCRALRKPLAITEFGKKAGEAKGERDVFFSRILERCIEHMTSNAPLAGTVFWMAAAPSYPDHDGFTVYFSGEGAQPSIREGFVEHSKAIERLNNRDLD